MTVITWNFNIENRPHSVKLAHGTLRSGREIWVDGVSIQRGRIWFDAGSHHVFSIDGQLFDLGILSNGFTFSYLLLRDNLPIPSERDLRKGRTAEDLRKSAYLRDLGLWSGLGQQLGVPYRPIPEAMWAFRHRLLGMLNGCLVMVTVGVSAQYRAGWAVLVRHASFAGQANTDSIVNDERIAVLLGRRARQKKPHIFGEQHFTAMLLPEIKHETAAALAGRVRTFLSVVADYTLPVKPDECENPACSHRPGSQVQLITLNGNPQFFCQDCIEALPGLMKQEQQAYKNAPNNLDAGLLAGLGAALLGAVGWAAVALIFARMTGLFPLAILTGVVWVMDRVAVKRSVPFILVSGGLTLFSVFLGNLLAAFLLMVRWGAPLRLATLGAAWRGLFEEPANLKLSMFLTVFLVGLMIFQYWLAHRAALERTFQPKVELLPGKL